MRYSIYFLLGFVGTLCIALIVTTAAQTANSLQVGTFTLSVPATNPAVTVNSPAKPGTLALTSDIPVNPPGATVIAGSVTLSGTATFNGLSAAPICTVNPVFTVSATGLQVTRLDYVCTPKNN